MLDRISEGDAVDKGVRQGLCKAQNHIQAWPIELIFYGREAVLHYAPLRSKRSRIPRVVDVAERELFLGRQGMVDAEQLLTPVRRR